MTDKNELKRLAKEVISAAELYAADICNDYLATNWAAANDAFGGAASPAAILALFAENERLRGCEEVLRQLASYCGAGGYNAPEVDPEVFAKKIMDGINILNDPLAQLAEKRGAERDQLKAENELLRKLAGKNSSELRKASAWICRAVEVGTESATHWAIRLNKNADLIDATIGEGEQS